MSRREAFAWLVAGLIIWALFEAAMIFRTQIRAKLSNS